MDFSAPLPTLSVSFQENSGHILCTYPSSQPPQGNNTVEGKHPHEPQLLSTLCLLQSDVVFEVQYVIIADSSSCDTAQNEIALMLLLNKLSTSLIQNGTKASLHSYLSLHANNGRCISSILQNPTHTPPFRKRHIKLYLSKHMLVLHLKLMTSTERDYNAVVIPLLKLPPPPNVQPLTQYCTCL